MREPVIAVSLQVLYLWLVSKKDFFIAQLVSNKWSCFFLSSSLVAAAAEGFPVLIYFFLQFLVACSSAAPPGRLYCGGFHLFVFLWEPSLVVCVRRFQFVSPFPFCWQDPILFAFKQILLEPVAISSVLPAITSHCHQSIIAKGHSKLLAEWSREHASRLELAS